jgi:hypothetical protein
MAGTTVVRPPTKGTGGKKLSWNFSDREEWIADIGYVADTQTVMPTNAGALPNDRYMLGLRLEVMGRITNPASGGPTVINADAPWSMIEKIDIQGYHRPRAQQEDFYNLRGVDTYNLFGMVRTRFPSFKNLVNSTLPFTSALVTTASATQDFIFYLDIWFPPAWPGDPGFNRQQMAYALDLPNYDKPVLTIQWGDMASLFGAWTTAPTFTAYGSASGSPKARVIGIFMLAGQTNLFKGYVPGRVWRYFTENVTGDILNTVTQSRQYNIPRGYRIGRVLVKTGVKSTVTTAGNNAYVTGSDSIFANVKFNYGVNKVIRFYDTYFAMKEAPANEYANYPNPGYAMFDFLKHGNTSQALNAEALVAGPTGDVDVYITADITGASNQASLFAVEELRGKPTFVS